MVFLGVVGCCSIWCFGFSWLFYFYCCGVIRVVFECVGCGRWESYECRFVSWFNSFLWNVFGYFWRFFGLYCLNFNRLSCICWLCLLVVCLWLLFWICWIVWLRKMFDIFFRSVCGGWFFFYLWCLLWLWCLMLELCILCWKC